MTDTPIQPWIAVNGYMDDEYRHIVVDLALRHLPHASADLKALAGQILSQTIRVPGFRSFRRAPAPVAVPHVAKKMQQVQGVTTAVICLWAESEESLISDVQTSLEAAGIHFQSDWTWREAQEGFLTYEDTEPLSEHIEALVEDKPKPESDHCRLAMLWLSRAWISEPSEQTTISETPEETSAVQDQSPSHEAITDAPPKTLPTLRQSIAEQLDSVQHAQQTMLASTQALLETVKASDPPASATALNTLPERLTHWQDEQHSLERSLHQSQNRIHVALEMRPDLTHDAIDNMLLLDTESQAIALEAVAESTLSAIDAILEHDRTKQTILNQVEQIHGEIIELQDNISHWTEDALLEPDVTHFIEGEATEFTLTELQEALNQVTAEQERIANQRMQLRELSISRIVSLRDQFLELDISGDTIILDDLSLDEVSGDRLQDVTSQRLWKIEQELEDLINEITQERLTAPESLAEELYIEWDEQKLVDLLRRLAKDKRDTEALLLLLGANIIHPRAEKLSLDRSVVASLLRGLEQLSSKAQPFELLNLLASDFIAGWQPTHPYTEAELCLVMLSAHYGADHRLPDGFFWQVSADWPVDRMPNWQKLWQFTLQNDPVTILTEDQVEDFTAQLDHARSQASQMLAREHGVFVRLNSLRSARHRKLLRTTIMPDLLSHFESLQQLEQKLHSADHHAAPHALSDLEDLVNKLTIALDEDTLIEAYERGANQANIDDSDGFHRRSSLRIIDECANSVLDYGAALVDHWHQELQRDASLDREGLQTELSVLSELTPLGQAALERIVQGVNEELPQWDTTEARSLAGKQLIRKLLSQATYSMRLPCTIGYLTGTEWDWELVLYHLLHDLADPADTADVAAELLLESEAPDHALLLTQFISLDIQNQAQSLRRKKEQETDELKTALMKAGGEVEDLLPQQDLGRWELVERVLQERLEEQRVNRQAAERRAREQALALRQRINDLEATLFHTRDNIPIDVYDLVARGLYSAKRATESEEQFSQVEAYLEEIHYRLDHKSWPLAELRDAVDQLEQAPASESEFRDTTPAAEDVLNLLERGELRRLDLNPDEITTSEVGTRCELLRHWLIICELPTTLSEGLKVSDRNAIHTLYRYFARMVSMRQWRPETTGNPMIYEDPVVYSYWELRYPKTTALETQCILVALAGSPPSPKDLSQLEHLMEDQEWLDYYFVFVFVPGCTPEIKKRFQSSYRHRRLVIIDEPAILDMIRAEVDRNKPLERLRPMMLNAMGAENVDVFTVNQLVNSRTSIFVGRDSLVNRIASSGDNYAVYGGRRIGKSSVLMAVKDRLKRRETTVILHSFEGDEVFSDNATARRVARRLELENEVSDVGDLKLALQARLDADPDLNLVLLLDEIDRYIDENPERHVLIETLRALSDHYGSRFRVVIAGFMSLYDCLHCRGPYTPASDPWMRMLNDTGPLENLRPASAERIVREGFNGILGWKFENRAIPRHIVERTGGHPAFVQYFCLKLQQRVAHRGDRLARLDDVDAVFADRDPEQSFIAYIRKTLAMNLDAVSQYLIHGWLVAGSSEAQGFTLGQMRQIAELSETPIPEERLNRSLERLSVTSVVKARAPEVYEFSVPDYPAILDQLGEKSHLTELENQLKQSLARN